jgi:hypothetical protein
MSAMERVCIPSTSNRKVRCKVEPTFVASDFLEVLFHKKY